MGFWSLFMAATLDLGRCKHLAICSLVRHRLKGGLRLLQGRGRRGIDRAVETREKVLVKKKTRELARTEEEEKRWVKIPI